MTVVAIGNPDVYRTILQLLSDENASLQVGLSEFKVSVGSCSNSLPYLLTTETFKSKIIELRVEIETLEMAKKGMRMSLSKSSMLM